VPGKRPVLGPLDGARHRVGVPWWGLAVGVALVCTGARAAPPTVLVDRELAGASDNVDDVCFWVNRTNPEQSLVFTTWKDSGTVEVFRVSSGALVTTITGFQHPNNCAVVGNLLLTTDADAAEVVVHHLPDFGLVRRFGRDMGEPQGIDVLTRPGELDLAYVTDGDDASVHVYEVFSGAFVRSFSTGFGGGVEPILVDDLYERVFVARGEDEDTFGIGLFTPDGAFVREFGEEAFSRDVEGMATYACGGGGYLVAADQRSNETEFEVFDRVSLAHRGTFRAADAGGEYTNSTDGLDILQTPLARYPSGVLAACDGCGSSTPEAVDVISWDAVAAALGLARCPDGKAPGCASVRPDRAARRMRAARPPARRRG